MFVFFFQHKKIIIFIHKQNIITAVYKYKYPFKLSILKHYPFLF